MKYFLDTNTAIAIINDAPRIARERMSAADGANTEFAISSIVLFELWFGVANSRRWAENAASLRAFLARSVATVPFDDDDARAAADLRATLNRNGTPIGPYDVLIAAQAIRYNAILVTSNTSEFARAPGLVYENWSESG